MDWQRKTEQLWPGIIGLLLFLCSALALSAAAAEQPVSGFGRYYAIVIGNQHYQHLEELPTAHADAQEVARMLKDGYGFEVELLLDADREQIMRTLARLPEQISSGEDNLLIYYAGRSYLNDKSGAGYWQPVDAKQDSSADWIPTALVSNILKSVRAKHVLAASGSCYSGSLIPLQSDARQLRQIAETPSFTVLTSGCEGMPAREFGAGHSQFTWNLLRILHGNQDVLTGSRLSEKMKENLEQLPRYGFLSKTEQQQGDFLFVPKQIQERALSSSTIQQDDTIADAAMLEAEPEAIIDAAADDRAKKSTLDLGAQPQQGDVMVNNLTGMEFVYVPAGCFKMGAAADERGRFAWELPAHDVCVEGFWMGKHEVTQRQWQAVMNSNPSGHPKSDQHPVENVSWEDVHAFLAQLNSSTGRNYHLPTEAEWEYACRAGGSGKYCGGDEIDNLAWHEGNSGGKTHETGAKQANAFGLHDMSGNVWEWCADKFSKDYYKVSIRYNPQGPTEGDNRVVRGGSLGSKAQNCRAAFRFRNRPDYREDWLGFRIMLR